MTRYFRNAPDGHPGQPKSAGMVVPITSPALFRVPAAANQTGNIMETITLYYSLSGKLVDEDGKPLAPDARPELTPGVTYEIELVPVAGASAAGTYTLSADIDFYRSNLMVQSTTATAGYYTF
ncbi:MAG: hypothetical protein EOM14_16155, partial [Clostridia bacterium]|nr:hypothetical protein [Clostridia bacterium]